MEEDISSNRSILPEWAQLSTVDNTTVIDKIEIEAIIEFVISHHSFERQRYQNIISI